MAWIDDKYVRNLLDRRERWGTVLTMTAVAGLFLFLSDHPHRSWLNLGPLVVGAIGSLYVLVVNCYYKQAESIANVRSTPNGESQTKQVKDTAWIAFAREIGFLGWMNIVVPLIVGASATLALYFGLLPTIPTQVSRSG